MKKLKDQTLTQRYLKKDRKGPVIETPRQLFMRVASHIAAVEAKYGRNSDFIQATSKRFYTLMETGKFLPNSPTLMNAGRENGLLSACFVLPIEDSIDGIFSTVKNTAQIQKAGGGTGFSFDRLRPTGDLFTSSGGKTSGPISFWRVVSETTNAIQQGAFRRGANMGMMSLDHPDILKFIHAKKNLSAFNNFNISVKIPNDFMETLDNDPEAPHRVINPRTGQRYFIPRSVTIDTYTIDDLIPEGLDANDCYTVKDIWEMIVRNAHETGEPGICLH
jgi:ribonucleoside-diphosphate reductase alpha chain